MRLISFRVNSFRSVNDSGDVAVAQRTVLVGRNESGKTAILKALQGVKGRHEIPGAAPQEMVAFTLARDFPRDRPRAEFSQDAVITKTVWELSDADRRELAKLWPRGATAKRAIVNREYKTARKVNWEGQKTRESVAAEGKAAFDRAARSIRTALRKIDNGEPVEAVLSKLDDATQSVEWVTDSKPLVAELRTTMATAGIAVPKPAMSELEALEAASDGMHDGAQVRAAQDWTLKHLPVFVYVDEWDEVPGHHVIPNYIQRRDQNTRTDADRMFEKLLKVAELNADELHAALNGQHEERTLLTDRAGRVFTKRLRELWKDREIEVQFRLDANHFDVLVKDKENGALVPLDERSRGFRWYFSFYVTFTADTLGGDKENAILLLDEPGLFLHALAQGQLLKFFKQLKNQIIYSTHSPFMIDPADLGSARTVTLESGTGTVVSADLSGDAKTLFPLQAALGYDLTQTLFVGTKNVVIEGVTDYWYLMSVAEHLRAHGLPSLPRDVVLTPAGGAPKVTYLVSLLASQNLEVVVLLDAEPAGTRAKEDLVKSKLVRSEAVVHVADAFDDPKPKEADVEDLIDPGVFEALVKEAYARELAGKTLKLNAKIPRIVPRVEAAFAELGLSFAKSRVASLYMRKMATAPDEMLTGGAQERIGELLRRLTQAVEKLGASGRGPFS